MKPKKIASNMFPKISEILKTNQPQGGSVKDWQVRLGKVEEERVDLGGMERNTRDICLRVAREILKEIHCLWPGQTEWWADASVEKAWANAIRQCGERFDELLPAFQTALADCCKRPYPPCIGTVLGYAIAQLAADREYKKRESQLVKKINEPRNRELGLARLQEIRRLFPSFKLKSPKT